MESIALFLLGVHLVGAAIWVGGSVALGVVATVLGRGRAGGATDDLVRVAQRLGWVMWTALLVAILTGLYNLTWAFPDGVDPGSTPGQALMAKFALIGVVLVAGGAHSFVLGPRLRRARASGRPPEEVAGLVRWSRNLGILTTVASVLVLFAAAFLGAG
jgi:putative copper export protein